MRISSFKVACLILLLQAAVLLEAQVNTASLSCLTTDPSGAVIANTAVIITNRATGYSRTVHTDSSGAYSFQDIPIGEYTVTVSASGFVSVSEQLTLAVGQRAREDFHLEVGSTQQTLEVQSGAAMLSRDDASIGTAIGATTIQETPLSLRNWDDLLRVVPGVQISRCTQQSGATSAGGVGDTTLSSDPRVMQFAQGLSW